MSDSDLPPLAHHLAATAGTPEDPLPLLRERLQQQLPEYRLLTTLGQGGMGAVYRAHHERLDRTVAVKVLLPNPETPPGWEERFLREARALAKLAHPGIVTVYDYGQAEGLSWIVMEYVDGVNLRTLMEDGRLPPADALAIIPQVCAALQCAHDRGIVHRDVKPENILLDEAGQVRIVDFGLAKLMDAGSTRLSGSGQAMGTLRYMAPEQLERPAEVDHRADIFSLGVVFYELLTGRVPVGSVQPPSAEGCEDERLDEMVMRSMEREPGARYQRAEDLQEELSGLSQGSRAQQPSVGEPTDVDELRPRLRWACSALGGLGLLTLLGSWTERLVPIRDESGGLVSLVTPVEGYATLHGLGLGILLLGVLLAHACLFSHKRGRTTATVQAALGLAAMLTAFSHAFNDSRSGDYHLPLGAGAVGLLILLIGLASCFLRGSDEAPFPSQVRSATHSLRTLARRPFSVLLGERGLATTIVFGLGALGVLASWEEASTWNQNASAAEGIALSFALLAAIGLARFKSAQDVRTGVLLQGGGAVALAAWIAISVPDFTDVYTVGLVCAGMGAVLAFLRLRFAHPPASGLQQSSRLKAR